MGHDLRHLLIIAYEFPPFGGSGVYRTIKFVKYLKQFGWRCTIIAPDFDKSNLQNSDAALVSTLPPETKIVRARCIDLYDLYRFMGGHKKQGAQESAGNGSAAGSRRISSLARLLYNRITVPDSKIGWYPAAVRAGERIIFDQRPDALFSTSPRETAHLIASRLARRHHIPWVADFRDPWTGAFFRPGKIVPFSWINAALERHVIDKSDAITVAWPGLKSRLHEIRPSLKQEKTTVILNGYDPHDVEKISPARMPGYSIVHAGKFIYPERMPTVFLNGLELLLRNRPELRSIIRVYFFGGDQNSVVSCVDKLRLNDVVKIEPRISQAEALSYIYGASCLLLLNSDGHAAGSRTRRDDVPPSAYIPGKLYDYFGAARPVLAFAQNHSASAELLKGHPSASIVTETDAESAARGIERLYELDCENSEELPVTSSYTQKFDCRALAGKLSLVLDKCIGAARQGRSVNAAHHRLTSNRKRRKEQ